MAGAFRLCASVVLAFVILGGACTPPADLPEAWNGDFELGEFAVGFRTEEIVRNAADSSPRTLTLSVWYPAGSGDPDARMTVRDFFEIALDEGQLAEPLGLSLGRGLSATMTGDSAALAPDRARTALAAPTLAGRNAPPAPGPFPLALWSSRHATVLAQAPLAEVLASHGMVVATVWSSDPPLAFIWENRPDAEKAATIEAQTEDLQHALSVLRDDPSVDTDRVIVLAWSYGGPTAANLVEREDAVRAVIGLDGGVIPTTAPEGLLALRRPFVYAIGRDTTRRAFSRLNDLTSPWITVRLPELAHGNFNAMEGYLPAVYEADTVFSWSRGGEVAVEGYRALVRMVVEATTAFVQDSAPTMADLGERLRRVGGEVEVRHAEAREIDHE